MGMLAGMKCRRAKTFLAVVAAVLPASLGAVAQETQGPDLKTTVEFMNRMVEPEHRIIGMANQCELTILNNMAITFLLPDGTTETKDQSGVPQREFTFAEIEDPFRMGRFKLSDVDPSSIKSHGGVSPEFLARLPNPPQPADLKAPDITVVNFGTTDLKKSIEVGGLKDSGAGNGTKILDKTGSISSWMFAFKSKDRAERFVTAFVHAVKLCGGKAPDFPPTPTEKR